MRYGYFDDNSREYVITRPDTPLPWINYLGNEEYFGLISNTAGGYSFYRDARLRRLTRYRYNNTPLDVGGRYLYLRDNESGEFWSPSWQPVRRDLDEYTCRHGMGYTTINAAKDGIKSQSRYFVPLGENLEIWQVQVSNERAETAVLSLFSSIEFCLWDAWDDATNYQRNLNIGQVEIEDGVIYHKTEYRERRDHFAYFACSADLAGFDTQREDFWAPIAAGTTRQRWRKAKRATPMPTAGRPSVPITCSLNWLPAKHARSFLCWATLRIPKTPSLTRPVRKF
jgi:cellobiose phosphorylase